MLIPRSTPIVPLERPVLRGISLIDWSRLSMATCINMAPTITCVLRQIEQRSPRVCSVLSTNGNNSLS